LVVFKRFCFPHTVANKLTGFLLFLVVPTFFWTVIPVAVVSAVATFAAIQEGRVLGDGEYVANEQMNDMGFLKMIGK
jgi:CDP-diacylglycerol--glycerol-3-phosphate 3-phosphatidyltransferase